MSPVLRYNDSGTWTGLPLTGQPGPPGIDGAPGAVGATGPSASDQLVARAGDAMTGQLALAADPAAPLEAATKQYVDRAGNPGSSMYGTFPATAVPNGESALVPIPTAGTGLTVGPSHPAGGYSSVIFNRTGYYLIHFTCAVTPVVPPNINWATLILRHNETSTRGMSSFAPGEDITSTEVNLWCEAGSTISFHLSQQQALGVILTTTPLSRFAVRFLGGNH